MWQALHTVPADHIHCASATNLHLHRCGTHLAYARSFYAGADAWNGLHALRPPSRRPSHGRLEQLSTYHPYAVVSPFIRAIDAHMTRRILMFTAALVLSTSSLAGATTHPIAIKGVANLSAAPRGGLSVVLATLSNISNKPITIYRIRSVVATPAMLHYDVNMCDKGQQMNTLPMVIIAPHQSLRLSTRGVGAMLFPLNRALRQKSQISLQITYRWKGMADTFVTSAIVTKELKGLVSAPPKNSVN